MSLREKDEEVLGLLSALRTRRKADCLEEIGGEGGRGERVGGWMEAYRQRLTHTFVINSYPISYTES